ncbi:MAG: hypothetical protein CMI32_04305, partial [Opitutales bacterium]|nr:hypothetical protein [Opitutales bacterium]
INFAAIPNQLLSAGTYTLEANATSGLGLTFTSANTAVATIAGNVVTLVSGGTADITASQAGSSIYDAASDVTQTLTVQDDTLQPQTITWTQDLSSVAFGNTVTLTATASSGGPITYTSSDSGIATISGSDLTVTGAGTATITANQAGGTIGGSEWQTASATKDITIAKVDQIITFPIITPGSVGDFDIDPGATSDSGLAVTYASSNTAIATIVDGKVHLVGPGVAMITASQAGDTTYNAAPNVTRPMVVSEFNMYANSIPGLKLWLDSNDVNADNTADTPSDFLAGLKVSQWSDHSLEGNHVTQGTNTNMPVYAATQTNGKPSVTFNGDQFLELNNALGLSGSPSLTMITVAKKTGAADKYMLMHIGGAGQRLALTSHARFGYGNGELAFTSGFADAVTLGSFRLKNPATYADGQFFRNGTELTGTATNGGNTMNLPATGGALWVGGRHDGSNGFIGDIAEIAVFDRGLHPWIITKIEGYLAHKWGTEGDLPAGHEFKANKPRFGGAQTITFGALEAVGDNAAPFEITTAYATSGLDLTYASSNTAVATVSGNVITVIAEGTTTISANQGGDSHYTAAAEVTQDLVVTSKQAQTINFAMTDQGLGSTVTLDGNATSGLPLSYAVTSGNGLVSFNSSTNAMTFNTLGSVTVQATQAGNNDYFAATPVDVTFQIKAGQVMVFQDIGDQGVDDSPTLHAITKDSVTNLPTGLPVTFTVVSGGASISNPGGVKKVVCLSLGEVVVQASQGGNATYAPVSDTVSFTIGNKQGQEIVFPEVGKDGGLRNLPLGRRPFFLPPIKTNRDLLATLEVENVTPGPDLFELDGNKLILKGRGLIRVTAKRGGDANYYAAADVSRIFEIKPPGRGAFFDERRLDDRFTAVRNKFKARLLQQRGLSDADAQALFDEDSADSDGDGVSNVLERAFGMDSLGPDSRKSLPRGIKTRSDGKQRITFVRYKEAENAENIEYKVEVSSDLRVWSASGVSKESSIDVGGGMERVTYVTGSAVSSGNRQYLRLTITSP